MHAEPTGVTIVIRAPARCQGPANVLTHEHHNRGPGFAADMKNHPEAALVGWRVVRLGPNELAMESVGRLVALVSGG